MQAQLKEKVQGSQVLAGVAHTYGDSQSKMTRNILGSRGRAAKGWQVLCKLMVTLNNI